MTGVSVGQISVAMGRCPTMTKNQFHGPSLQYMWRCAQPSFSTSWALQACDCPNQPLGEGRAVQGDSLHFRPLSGGTLLCSIVAGDVGWMLGLIPQTREGHGCSVVGLQETTPQTPPLPPRCVQVLQPLLSFIPAQELI